MSNDTSESPLKQCTICQSLFPANPQYFNRRTKSSDGLNSRCRECSSATQRGDLVVINPFKRRDGRKTCKGCLRTLSFTTEFFYPDKSKPGGLSSQCIECKKRLAREYANNNPEKIREATRNYWLNNKEVIKEKSKEYKKRNRHKSKIWNETYRTKHPARIKKSKRDWDINNPEYVRAKQLRRRARKAALPKTFSEADYKRMMEYWGNACAITGATDDIHVDHWIPLFSDECPGTVPENMIPLQGRLNESKNDREPAEWLIWKFGEVKAIEILQRIERYIEWVQSTQSK